MALEIPGGRGASMYILGGIGLFLVWSTLAIRAHVRARLLHQWGWDDWMMAAAVLCFTVMAGGMFSLAKNRFGEPAYTLPVETLVDLYKATIVGELGYVTTSMFFRLCVCCFYLRLTPVMWQIWTIRVLMVITTVYSIIYFCILLNQCAPVSYFWTHFHDDTTGTCLSSPVILISTYVHNSISALADWILNSLPLFIIIPASIDRRTKVSALALLGLGAVASIGIIVRFVALFTITSANSAVPLSPAVAFWSALELVVGMVAANLATYRPLFRSLTKSVRSGPATDASPGSNSIINLSKIRWPKSRRSHSVGYPRSGYILSADEPEQDGLAAWESELGLSRRTAGSSAGITRLPRTL
ncbi:hypothetical protein B0J12DRAFT_301503 [Macrophomina phaseolina]|uniref:Rhodopsin domain-containing protein n=1 Tax=Macrophomina phaseolina TaxID=35725 RepID=A0ABQ8GPD6_9PEZI|nr:hypothetical protein B0J12DRAFT_301503 [Macrophomina phaseolina]